MSRPLSLLLVLLLLVIVGCGDESSDELSTAAPQPTQLGLLPVEDVMADRIDSQTGSEANGNARVAEANDARSAGAGGLSEQERLDLSRALSCLSKRQRVAQLLMPLVTQPEIDQAAALASRGEIGAVALLGSPTAELGGSIERLRAGSFVPVMVASDEEGGSVQRLKGVLGAVPSAATLARSETPQQVQSRFADYGRRARELGIDVVLGPVLDVGSGPGIESRSFGSDPSQVIEYGAAVATGLKQAGLVPVFKHFPGHGRASADSHDVLPTTPSLEMLRELDLAPFVALLGDPTVAEGSGVMVAHLLVPGLSEQLPTTMSRETIEGLLRSELGFDGLVFSDAVNMGAIAARYEAPDAAEAMIRAGVTIVILGGLAELVPTIDHLTAVSELESDFGVLVDLNAYRVLVAKDSADLCVGAR